MPDSSLNLICEKLWPATRDFLREMVAVNSFTTHTIGVQRMGELVASHFSLLGFIPQLVPHSSTIYGSHLILRRPLVAGAPTVALIGHLDTVFPEDEEIRNHFHWRVEGDRVYGPGTNDIKGGIASIYHVLAALREHTPDMFEATNWLVLCNACEETDSQDFGEVCRAQLPADTAACLIFEADGGEHDDFSLVTARNGRATFRVDVQGRGAHAGGSHARGANAIVQLGRVIDRLESLTNYETGPTVNVGRIQGGTVLNRVPETASAELEMRAFSVPIFDEAKARILSWTGSGDVSSRDGDDHHCQIIVTQLDESSPWPQNEASDHLLAIWQQAGADLGFTVGTERRGGLSDGNVLWNHFPTLDGLGPRGDHSHCSENAPDRGKTQEFADLTSFIPKAILNAQAIITLLSPTHRPS